MMGLFRFSLKCCLLHRVYGFTSACLKCIELYSFYWKVVYHDWSVYISVFIFFLRNYWCFISNKQKSIWNMSECGKINNKYGHIFRYYQFKVGVSSALWSLTVSFFLFFAAYLFYHIKNEKKKLCSQNIPKEQRVREIFNKRGMWIFHNSFDSATLLALRVLSYYTAFSSQRRKKVHMQTIADTKKYKSNETRKTVSDPL